MVIDQSELYNHVHTLVTDVERGTAYKQSHIKVTDTPTENLEMQPSLNYLPSQASIQQITKAVNI
jgi:hypothetical protein